LEIAAAFSTGNSGFPAAQCDKFLQSLKACKIFIGA
jgi:hypothetical protein